MGSLDRCILDTVQVAATEILQVARMPAYHTSIILGGREYFFDADGIASAPALWSHLAGFEHIAEHELSTEVFTVGYSAIGGSALVLGLESFFLSGTYDVLLKNCNAFTDAAVYFLTRKRLSAKFSRLERLLAGTRPVSTKLLSALLSATQDDPDALGIPQEYDPNPLAENFTVEDVVARCDALDAASYQGQGWGIRVKDRSIGVSSGGMDCSCVTPACNPIHSGEEFLVSQTARPGESAGMAFAVGGSKSKRVVFL